MFVCCFFFLKTLRASCQTKVSKTLSALNGSSRRSHLFDITYAHKDILAATLPVATWCRHCCWDWILDFIECSSFFSCKEMFGSLPPFFFYFFWKKATNCHTKYRRVQQLCTFRQLVPRAVKKKRLFRSARLMFSLFSKRLSSYLNGERHGWAISSSVLLFLLFNFAPRLTTAIEYPVHISILTSPVRRINEQFRIKSTKTIFSKARVGLAETPPALHRFVRTWFSPNLSTSRLPSSK